jgi:hypothetical protein
MKTKILIFGALLILTLGLATTAFGEEAIPACTGDQVTGTLVDFDPETNTATIDTGEGLCTVVFNDEYDHPIVNLLGGFFSVFDPEDLAGSLQATKVCIVQDPLTLEWSLYEPAEGEDCPGQEAMVTAINEDGSFALVFSVEGVEQQVNLVVDESTAAAFLEALESLLIDWELNNDGSFLDTGSEIAAYHDSGIGFGVLVKLYAISMASQEACEAEPVGEEEPVEDPEAETPEESCGVSVEQLVMEFEGGAGIGDLFKTYGKPELLGVGHIRKLVSGEDHPSDKTKGICNAIANGVAPQGHDDVDCGEEEISLATDSEPRNNKTKDKPNKNKPNKNNGKND